MQVTVSPDRPAKGNVQHITITDVPDVPLGVVQVEAFDIRTTWRGDTNEAENGIYMKANTHGKIDLHVFDMSDPDRPVLLGSKTFTVVPGEHGHDMSGAPKGQILTSIPG